MNKMPPVVHIVDDDASFRLAIARLLQASGCQVALYESAAQLLEKQPSAGPGCILLDIKMPDLDGLQLQDRLGKIGNMLPIVFVTGHGDIPMSVRAIKAGAEEFLCKPVSKERLLQAIRVALARYEEESTQRGQLGALRACLDDLTRREREVFEFVICGTLNKQIAFELGTSVRTIKAHRHAVMHKLQASSLAELVTVAAKLGFVTGPDGVRIGSHQGAAARPACSVGVQSSH
jgi:FixJ family two-component response regulator